MRKTEVIEWVELIWFLSDASYINRDKISCLAEAFSKVTLAGPNEKPKELPAQVTWYSYNPDKDRSEIWNNLLARAQENWVFFLEDNEEIDFNSFPEKGIVNRKQWAPVCILYTENDKPRQYYQMRFLPAGKAQPFEGKNLVDCTRYIRENNISLIDTPTVVKRDSSPVQHVKVEEELSVKTFSPKLYLVQGERDLKAGKIVHAAAQYRKLLKEEKLLPFDRLAAVNGLTSCLAEQYKWNKTMALAQKSIDAEPLQRLPYLIQFRVFQLNKQWNEALEVLDTYFNLLNQYSRASFDKAISEEETLLNLIELALKAGKREQASDYLENLFNLKEGNVDRSFLHKVLVLSIELSDYERSVFFFKRMFKGYLPDKLNDDQLKELNHFMSMFMKNGWYEYALEIYNQLYEHQPQNNLFKRRLIVTLSKTQRMEKARTLIAGSG